MSNSLTDLETKEFLLSIIGNSPIGTIVLDMEGNITVINSSAKELLGLKGKINTYLNKFILSQVEGIKELDVAVIDCITNGRKPFSIIEVRYHHKFLNIKGEKTLNGMVLAFEDLTSVITSRDILKQKSEELEKKNSELTEFNHITSHDLQEPLKTIIGFSNLLNEESITTDIERKEYVNIISQVAHNMSSKINELLEYSRLGRANVLSAIDCNLILEKLKTNIKSTIKDKKVTIEYHKLPVIHGYEEDIYSLFQNLVSNSIKFHTQKMPIKIIIEAKQKKNFWSFSVADNGIGIDLKDSKKIFTIFQRLHNTKEFPGTGIGLAMSKKIVEIHQGEIWVESATNKGSKFLFTIKKQISYE